MYLQMTKEYRKLTGVRKGAVGFGRSTHKCLFFVFYLKKF